MNVCQKVCSTKKKKIQNNRITEKTRNKVDVQICSLPVVLTPYSLMRIVTNTSTEARSGGVYLASTEVSLYGIKFSRKLCFLEICSVVGVVVVAVVVVAVVEEVEGEERRCPSS